VKDPNLEHVLSGHGFQLLYLLVHFQLISGKKKTLNKKKNKTKKRAEQSTVQSVSSFTLFQLVRPKQKKPKIAFAFHEHQKKLFFRKGGWRE
jgi:hypothetical protein